MHLWMGRSIKTPVDLVTVIITLSYPKLPPLNVTLWKIKASGIHGVPWVISNTNHDNYNLFFINLHVSVFPPATPSLKYICMYFFSDMTGLYFLSLTNFLSFF